MQMLGRRVLVAVLATAACTSAAPPPPATTIPITSFQMVAGRWAGPVKGLPGPARDQADWIEVTIAEDGSYDFGIVRTIGMFGGKGKFTLKDGTLTSQSERGRAEYTLSERGGRQYLRAEGVLQNNIKVMGDLTRSK
jgi:hypothetical protein